MACCAAQDYPAAHISRYKLPAVHVFAMRSFGSTSPTVNAILCSLPQARDCTSTQSRLARCDIGRTSKKEEVLARFLPQVISSILPILVVKKWFVFDYHDFVRIPSHQNFPSTSPQHPKHIPSPPPAPLRRNDSAGLPAEHVY